MSGDRQTRFCITSYCPDCKQRTSGEIVWLSVLTKDARRANAETPEFVCWHCGVSETVPARTLQRCPEVERRFAA